MIDLTTTAAVVLAAGRGTRMNSTDINKVALKLGDKPMVEHTIEHLKQAGISQIIVVVGFQADSVRKALGNNVVYAVQAQQLGTGDAFKSALPSLSPSIDTVLAVYGDDSAFYPPELYATMVARKQSHGCDLLVLTIKKSDPTGLGRIVRDDLGNIVKIVEEKNASIEEKAIEEINTGFYCFDRKFLDQYIGEIAKNTVTGEYYLTDLVEIALSHGKKVEAYFEANDRVWHGVNRPEDLLAAEQKIHE